MTYYGDFPASHTALCMVFDSFAAATGAPSAVTNFAAGDVTIFKDGGTTQRTSSAGIVVSTSFDTNTGLQMVTIDLSDNTDAGFYAAGHEFQVAVADVTIDGQTVRFWLGSFSIERAGGVLARIKAGTVKVDVDTIKTNPVVNGGTITFPTTATLASTTNITAGTITTATNVTTVNGLAANVVTATAINADAITAAKIANSAIDLATFASDVPSLALRTGTATAGAATTITLDAGASASNDFYNNTVLFLTGGTGVGQSRRITAYVGATKVATVTTWVTNPDNTSTFAILPSDAVAVTGLTVADVAAIKAKTDNLPAAPASTTNITAGTITTVTNLTNAPTAGDFTATMKTSIGTAVAASAVASVTGNVGGNVVGSVASVVGAVGSVTGNVGGNVVGSVASVTAPVTIAAGQLFVKKNTQLTSFMFKMVLSSDNVTPATGKTVTVTRAIDGGSFASAANTPATEIASGWYKITLAAADLNGALIAFKATATACKQTDLLIVTQA